MDLTRTSNAFFAVSNAELSCNALLKFFSLSINLRCVCLNLVSKSPKFLVNFICFSSYRFCSVSPPLRIFNNSLSRSRCKSETLFSNNTPRFSKSTLFLSNAISVLAFSDVNFCVRSCSIRNLFSVSRLAL